MRVIHVLVLVALAVACTPLEAAAPPPTATSTTSTAPPTTTSSTATVATTTLTSTTTTTVSTTTTVPPTTTTTLPPRERLVIHGTGDVNLDPGFVRSFPTEGYEIAWSGLHGLFETDDLTVINLECSAGPGTIRWDKTWVFACDPAAYASAATAGVDVASPANNHGADWGIQAMLDGSELLRDAGITPVGAGYGRDDAYAPAVFELGRWTVAVLGLNAIGSETGSWRAGTDRAGVAWADHEHAPAAIRSAKETADIVLVTVHWGMEGDRAPAPWVRRLGEAYIEAGADGIFGHHTHRLGPLEWYRDRPIAWSLGNFVWQAYPEEVRDTAIARFVFEPDGRVGACLIPVRIERTGHPVIRDDPSTC